jgi:hypothetical protein
MITLNPNIAKNVAKAQADPKVKKGFVNLGNNKLNINTTTAKGLEKAIGVIAKFIINAQGKTNGILYGQFKLQEGEGNPIQRAFDRGIDNLLTDIADVDFCNIINYGINQISGSAQFNPGSDSIPTDPLGKAKWNLQNAAFKVQSKIDQYNASYGSTNNPESKLGLYTLIKQVNDGFSTVLAPGIGFNDPLLIEKFPQISLATNYINGISTLFNKYNSVDDIPSPDVSKILNTIDKIKFYCVAIQGLNSPANLISLVDTSLNGKVQDEIAKITKLIPINQVPRVLKSLLKVANNINSVGQNAIKYINTGRLLVKLLISLVQIFNIIKAFIATIIIPSFFGTKGADVVLNDTYQQKLTELGQKKLIKRLNQINAVLNLMAIFVTSLVAGMGSIIGKLNLILLNIENCNNIDPELKQDLIDTINNLSTTANLLQEFLDGYNKVNEAKTNQFGEYTIKIITEEVTDEGISIKRRYGIALDNNLNLVVESTPTFASLDLIIINEVKALLVSKGFVKSDLGSLSAEDTTTILEAIQYLDDDSIDIGNIQFNTQDIEEMKKQDAELGLTDFINNLPGGKALRKKVRKMMGQKSESLKLDLASTDPNRKYSEGITPNVSNIIE